MKALGAGGINGKTRRDIATDVDCGGPLEPHHLLAFVGLWSTPSLRERGDYREDGSSYSTD